MSRLTKFMPTTSTEEFGVINFEKLTQLRPTLGVLSELIDYPTAETFSPANRAQLANAVGLPATLKEELLQLFDRLAAPDFLSQQTNYAALFEMNRRYTLYMSYYKMTDSRERGTVLAKLKMLYEMFGVAESTSELSDYLPLILEFLSLADFEGDSRKDDLQLAFGVVEDGTYSLLQKAVSDSEEPYIQLVKLIRQVLRQCIINPEVKADA